MRSKIVLVILISILFSASVIGQESIPASVDEVMSVFNGKNILITYDYKNTKYSVDVNYCASKQFEMTSTQTTSSEMGGDDVTVIEYRGTWNITPDSGYNCVHYSYNNNARPPFLEPVYKQANGAIYIGGKNMKILGPARCF